MASKRDLVEEGRMDPKKALEELQPEVQALLDSKAVPTMPLNY
jgi:hypothetical protein